MSDAVGARLGGAATTAIIEDRIQNGLYTRIAETLRDEGLLDPDMLEGRATAWSYGRKLRRQAERKQARAQKKKVRTRKRKSSR
jgi:hypothetical protein